jgi:hypothetical protein
LQTWERTPTAVSYVQNITLEGSFFSSGGDHA